MFTTRRTELGKEHIRLNQVASESPEINTPPGGLTAVVIVMVTAQIH